MATEPVNERPLFPSLSRADSLGVSGWSIDLVRQLVTVFQQYGYKLNKTLLDEHLAAEGGSIPEVDRTNTWVPVQVFQAAPTATGHPLRWNELARNGGKIPEIDQTQTWAATQTFTPAQVFSAAPTSAGHPLRFNELAENGGTIPELDRNNLFAGTQSVANPILLDGEGWTTPTLLNGWVNYGGSYAVAGFRKLPSGLVVVKGLIKSGTTTAGTAMFNFPAGYRPTERLIITTSSGSAWARIDVLASGDLVTDTGVVSSWVVINFSFFAEQ